MQTKICTKLQVVILQRLIDLFNENLLRSLCITVYMLNSRLAIRSGGKKKKMKEETNGNLMIILL